jgi:hypothetical protein
MDYRHLPWMDCRFAEKAKPTGRLCFHPQPVIVSDEGVHPVTRGRAISCARTESQVEAAERGFQLGRVYAKVARKIQPAKR